MPTLAETLTVYLSLDRSPQTTHQYRRVLTLLVNAIGPSRDVSLITTADLLDYFASFSIKRSTINSYLSVVKGFFTWLVQAGYLPRSPAKPIRYRPDDADPIRNRAIPLDDLQRIVEVSRADPRDHALILFLADTGCRVGGLASLTIDRLDIAGRSALLLEKGGRWHRAYYGDETAAALQAYLGVRPHVATDRLFIRKDSTAMDEEAIRNVLARLCRWAKTSRIWRPHSIRHAVGHALAQRVPPSIVQRKLGHTNVATTLENYYPRDDQTIAAASKQHSLAAIQPLAEDPPANETTPVEPPKIIRFRADGQN